MCLSNEEQTENLRRSLLYVSRSHRYILQAAIAELQREDAPPAQKQNGSTIRLMPTKERGVYIPITDENGAAQQAGGT